MNLQSGEDAKMPGGRWKRWGVAPANRAVGEPDHPRPHRPEKFHFILMASIGHRVWDRRVAWFNMFASLGLFSHLQWRGLNDSSFQLSYSDSTCLSFIFSPGVDPFFILPRNKLRQPLRPRLHERTFLGPCVNTSPAWDVLSTRSMVRTRGGDRLETTGLVHSDGC